MTSFANMLMPLVVDLESRIQDLLLLDYNIIFSKPIIQLEDDRFFCPIADLLTNLHVVLPKLLEEEEKDQQTKVWEKFLNLRATFTEKKIVESLGAIFDKKKILQNLFYEFQGQRYEAHVLITYDNKIILLEAKWGFFQNLPNVEA